jgi:hypothetical protein
MLRGGWLRKAPRYSNTMYTASCKVGVNHGEIVNRMFEIAVERLQGIGFKGETR